MTITTENPSYLTTVTWAERADRIGAELRAGVAERDRTGEISAEVFADLRAAGMTSALVPVEFGGGGATFDELSDILRTLARHDASTAVTLSMHSHLTAAQVWRFRHGIDAEAVLRKIAAGAMLISTGASDWIGSNGRATRIEGGYMVSARKSPASGCEIGQVLSTSIRWDDAPDGPSVIHCSIPISADGVSIDRTWDTVGLRATGSHTVVFDDVFVPDAAVALIRPADVWHPVWNTVLGVAMPLIMSAYMGIADAAVGHAIAAAKPQSATLLGEVLNAHTTAADLVAAMVHDSDDLHFANTDAHAARTLSRKTVAEAAIVNTVRLTMELVGGSSYSRGGDMERMLRDAHGCQFHPLPRTRQLPFSGRVALGLSPVG